MTRPALTTSRRDTIFRRAMVLGMVLAGAGGCVNISAPDKPIVITLNINVTQEVVYRLDNEAKSLIKQNPGIF